VWSNVCAYNILNPKSLRNLAKIGNPLHFCSTNFQQPVIHKTGGMAPLKPLNIKIGHCYRSVAQTGPKLDLL